MRDYIICCPLSHYVCDFCCNLKTNFLISLNITDADVRLHSDTHKSYNLQENLGLPANLVSLVRTELTEAMAETETQEQREKWEKREPLENPEHPVSTVTLAKTERMEKKELKDLKEIWDKRENRDQLVTMDFPVRTDPREKWESPETRV